MTFGGAPDPDAFTLDRIGRGGIRGRHATTLERRTGETWTVMGSYADAASAGHALDEAIAAGGSPTDLRLVTRGNPGVQRLLLIGLVILAFLLVINLWQIID